MGDTFTVTWDRADAEKVGALRRRKQLPTDFVIRSIPMPILRLRLQECIEYIYAVTHIIFGLCIKL